MNLYYQEKLIAKAASLYYIKNLNQKQISNVLHISQATVSRLLDKAIKNKIVKVSVKSISGSFTNLEEQMCSKFNLTDCVIYKINSHADVRLMLCCCQIHLFLYRCFEDNTNITV